MFLYKGYDPKSKKSYRQEFDDESEAVSFAEENCDRFPKFNVIDLDSDDLIFNNKEADDNERTAMDNMFPDGEDSEEGFDWTKGE